VTETGGRDQSQKKKKIDLFYRALCRVLSAPLHLWGWYHNQPRHDGAVVKNGLRIQNTGRVKRSGEKQAPKNGNELKTSDRAQGTRGRSLRGQPRAGYLQETGEKKGKSKAIRSKRKTQERCGTMGQLLVAVPTGLERKGWGKNKSSKNYKSTRRKKVSKDVRGIGFGKNSVSFRICSLRVNDKRDLGAKGPCPARGKNYGSKQCSKTGNSKD